MMGLTLSRRMRILLILVLLLGLLLPGLAGAKDPAGTVLVLGDSLSAAHNIPADAGWVSLLQQRVRQQSKTPARIVNASMSGETTAGALTRLPGLLAKEKPTVVVIALGGNDALRGLTPAQVQGNLEKMVQASQKAGARVLLLGIDVPPNYGPAYRQRLAAAYKALATQYKVPLLPFLLATPVLFLTGAAMAYYVAIPMALHFLLSLDLDMLR